MVSERRTGLSWRNRSTCSCLCTGTLKGRVDVISADTFKDERTRAEDGNAHYKVRVRVDMGGLTDKQARIEIRPGMQAQVELHTGDKTVLQYLLKPLYKSREAFREP